jgi:hypothetical protein
MWWYREGNKEQGWRRVGTPSPSIVHILVWSLVFEWAISPLIILFSTKWTLNVSFLICFQIVSNINVDYDNQWVAKTLIGTHQIHYVVFCSKWDRAKLAIRDLSCFLHFALMKIMKGAHLYTMLKYGKFISFSFWTLDTSGVLLKGWMRRMIGNMEVMAMKLYSP